MPGESFAYPDTKIQEEKENVKRLRGQKWKTQGKGKMVPTHLWGSKPYCQMNSSCFVGTHLQATQPWSRLLCSSSTPSGEPQTQTTAHSPPAGSMTLPQPQEAHISSMPACAGKPGDGNRVIVSRSTWLKQQWKHWRRSPCFCTTWYQSPYTWCSSALPGQWPGPDLLRFLYTQQDTLLGTLESDTSPHSFHIWVVLPSKELVAAVSPHHVFIHRELYFTPEVLLFLCSHGEPGNTAATAACCQERNMVETRNKKTYFSFRLQRKTTPGQSFLITWKTDTQVCPEQQCLSGGLPEGASWAINGMTR